MVLLTTNMQQYCSLFTIMKIGRKLRAKTHIITHNNLKDKCLCCHNGLEEVCAINTQEQLANFNKTHDILFSMQIKIAIKSMQR